MGSDISVLRFSDHAIVTTVEGGADPFWIGDTPLALPPSDDEPQEHTCK